MKQKKNEALAKFTEKMVPGRWPYVRQPTASELKSTTVCRLPLIEVSAKVRVGGPKDDDEDYKSEIWAGVIPTFLVSGPPLPDIPQKGKPSSASKTTIDDKTVMMPTHVAEYHKVPSPRTVPGLGLSRIDVRIQLVLAILIAVVALLTMRVLKSTGGKE